MAVKIFARFRPLCNGQMETNCIQLVNGTTIKIHGEPSPGEETVRPIRRLLTSPGSRVPMSPVPGRKLVTSPLEVSGTPRPHMMIYEGNYKFNRVFGPKSTTEEVYEQTTGSLIDPLFQGYNCTVITYGQSGSGKTYTMMGYNNQDRGIIPRAIGDIFERAQTRKKDGWTVRISISNVQIYMEKVLDLLGHTNNHDHSDKDNSTSLPIRQKNEHIYVDGATWKEVTSVETCVRWIEECNRHRVVASTDLNSVSSRSHSVFIIQMEQVNPNGAEHLRSNFTLVDLAGSETVKRTNAQGLNLQQASHVNQSLSTLGNVISALSARKLHVPYRDSKLTRLLTHALGGNSRTVIILTCSLASIDIQETISTLQFGKRALDMPNQPVINKFLTIDDYKLRLAKAEEIMNQQKLVIESLERENRKLHAQVETDGTDASKSYNTEEDEDGGTMTEPSVVSITEEDERSLNEEDTTPRDDKTSVKDLRRGLKRMMRAVSTTTVESHMEPPYIMTPAPRAIAAPEPIVIPFECDDAKTPDIPQVEQATGELTLPPVLRSTRNRPNNNDVNTSPRSRYFTPRTLAALSSEMVQKLQQDKSELQSIISHKDDDINDLKDRLIETKDQLYEQKLQIVPDKVESSNEIIPSALRETPNDQMTTLDWVFISLGSIMFVAALIILLVVSLKYKVDLHWSVWATWSSAVVGTFLLGWGVPRI